MDEEKKPSSFVSKDEFETQEQVPFEKSEAEVKFVSKMNRHFIPFVCVILFLQVYTSKQEQIVVTMETDPLFCIVYR